MQTEDRMLGRDADGGQDLPRPKQHTAVQQLAWTQKEDRQSSIWAAVGVRCPSAAYARANRT